MLLRIILVVSAILIALHANLFLPQIALLVQLGIIYLILKNA